MKRVNIYVLMSCMLGMLSFSLEAASQNSTSTSSSYPYSASTSTSSIRDTSSSNSEADDEYDILRRDQVDTTSTLAIPLDDSEVEDEEEVNRIQGKDAFHLPHSR